VSKDGGSKRKTYGLSLLRRHWLNYKDRMPKKKKRKKKKKKKKSGGGVATF
jgi:hypothetical protein